MKKRGYILFIFALFVMLVVMQLTVEDPVDWNPTYSRYHKQPFGSMLLYERINDLFPKAEITTTQATVKETLEDRAGDDKKSCYLFSYGYSSFNQYEGTELLDYVSSGNHAFISASRLPHFLMDTLELESELLPFAWKDTAATIFLNDEQTHDKMSYTFGKGTGYYYFSIFPPDAHVVSSDGDGKAVTLSIPFGKGSFLLNTTPLVFTNYYMLNDTTQQYIARTLSYLPANAGTVIWDEFYRIGREGGSSPLRYILTTTPLKWAYFLLVGLGLIYLLTEIKRRQRMIPIIKKPANATVEFVSTIGRLYYQQGNHNDLARKKISYFLDDLRRRYFLRSIDLTTASAERVSMKSGIPQQEVEHLFNYMRHAEDDISSEMGLLTLNQVIENFYRKSK